MNIIFSIIKVIASSFPVGSSVVQIVSEYEATKINAKINKLLDPISLLHVDIKSLSEQIYKELKSTDSKCLFLDNDDFFIANPKPLAILEANGFIKLRKNINKSNPVGLYLGNKDFIAYLSGLYEDPTKITKLVHKIENCPKGEALWGKKLKLELDLPLVLIDAFFEAYVAKGYGLTSLNTNESRYLSKV